MKKHVKMKRIISFILAFIMIIQYLPKDNIVFASDSVGSVTFNGRTSYHSSVKSLWKAATSHGSSKVVVDLLSDWNTGDKNDVNSSLTVPSDADITINLNGHMIDRGLVNQSHALSEFNEGYGSGQVFYVKDNARLTINGGTKNITHNGYINKSVYERGVFTTDSATGGTPYSISGGLLTGAACDDSVGGGCITMKAGTVVTLNDVNITGNIACTGFRGGYGGAVRMYGGTNELYVNNSTIEYNYANEDGGAIYAGDTNDLINITNSIFNNNGTGNCGGAICTYGLTTKVRTSNTVFSNNYAKDSGGAIYICMNSQSTLIDLKENTVLYNNYAKEAGGAIGANAYKTSDRYAEYQEPVIITSTDGTAVIKDNTTDGNGGGIYLKTYQAAAQQISGFTITNNSAKNGGGIYIYTYVTQYDENYQVNINNVTVSKNSASKSGGGIYVYTDDSASLYPDIRSMSLSSSSIVNNTAGENAAGIYVETPYISGKVIIEKNYLTNGKEVDMYLGKNITGEASGSSRIGITRPDEYTSSTSDKDAFITYTSGDSYNYHEKAYFSNQSGVVVKRINTSADNKTPRYELRLQWGEAEPVEEIDDTTPVATTDTVNGKPVIKGYFSYPSVVDTEEDLDAAFYYSDGYFLNAPENYNTHLATMSMAMAMSAFYSNIGNNFTGDKASEKYYYKSENIKKLLTDIGVDQNDVYLSDTYKEKPGTNTIGYAIGKKTISDDGTILVPIAIRGAGYESEWYGNVSVGTSGEHEGFATAANQVFAGVQNYIKNYGLESAVNSGKVKFWVVGYSRAGATANLTSKRLVDAYALKNGSSATNNDVYGYCFEAPKGGINTEEYNNNITKYYGIHNCINKADAVPLVAPEEMGFVRYGVDHYVPGEAEASTVESDSTAWSYVQPPVNTTDAKKYTVSYDNSSFNTNTDNYYYQKQKMLKQLNAVDPDNINFEDYFKTATINYLGGGTGFKDFVSTVNSNLLVEDYNKILVRSLQAWGFYNGSFMNDFRYSYTSLRADEYNPKSKIDTMTFEDALQVFTKYIFSLDNSDYDSLLSCVEGAADRFGTFEMIGIYDNVVGDWLKISESKQLGYLNDFWDKIVKYDVYDYVSDSRKSILSYLTGSNDDNTAEAKELRKAFNTVLDVVFRVLAIDYKNNGRDWNSATVTKYLPSDKKTVTTPILEGYLKRVTDAVKSLNDSQIVIGTLAYNSSTILQAHYPEINFSWLRSYDSYYSNDTTKVDITENKTPTVIHNVTDGRLISEDDSTRTYHYAGDVKLQLGSDTKGALVLYKIKADDGDFSDWMLYNNNIELKNTKVNNTYTIVTKAVYLGHESDEVTSTYNIDDASRIFINDVDVTDKYPMSNVLRLNAYDSVDNSDDTYQFLFWRNIKLYDPVNKVSVSSGLSDKTNSILTDNKRFGRYHYYTVEFVRKVTNVKLELNTDKTDSTLTLTKADNNTVNTYNSSNWNIAYQYKSDEPYESEDGTKTITNKHITAEVTLYPLKDTNYNNPNYDNNKNVYFSSNVTGEIVNNNSEMTPEGNTTIEYNKNDGSVILRRTYLYKEEIDNFANIKVEYYDTNSNTKLGEKTYAALKGKETTITANDLVNDTYNGTFYNWKASDGSELTGYTINGNNITFTAQDDLTLRADYVPVMNKMDIEISELTKNGALPANVIKCEATAESVHDMKNIVSLKWYTFDKTTNKWVAAANTVQPGTNYKAVIEFNDITGYKYAVSDNLQLNISIGGLSTEGYLTKDSDGRVSITTYTTTPESYKLVADNKLIGDYEEGDIVSVSAANKSGKTFTGWNVTNGTITTFESGILKDSTITFKMPASDVTLEAEYADNITDIALDVSTNDNTTVNKTLQLKSGDNTISNYSDDKWDVSYEIKENSDTSDDGTTTVVTRYVTVAATLNPDKANNVYFDKNVTAVINDNDDKATTDTSVKYNKDDGRIVISRTFKYENTIDNTAKVTVQYYDNNSHDKLGEKTYAVIKGVSSSVTAPNIEYESFANWKDSAGNDLSGDFTVTDNKVTFTTNSDITLIANYVPVVNTMNITIDAVSKDNSLPTAVKKTESIIENTYDITNDVTLSWSVLSGGQWVVPSADVQAGTTYKATIKLNPTARYIYKLSDNLKINVMAGDIPLSCHLEYENNNPIIVGYVTTPKENYYSVVADDKEIGKYKAGDIVTVNADTNEAKQFIKWIVEKGSITLESGSLESNNITFKMPAEDVVLKSDRADKITNVALKVKYNNGTIDKSVSLKANDNEVTGYSEDKWNVSYNVAESSVDSADGSTTTTTKTVTIEALLNADADNRIYFADNVEAIINDNDNNANAKGETTVKYNPANGSILVTRVYEQIETKVNTVNVKVEYYDSNNNEKLGEQTYAAQKGKEISISAMAAEDEAFYAWSKVDGSIISSDATYTLSNDDKTITFTPDSDVTLKGLFIPVVKTIDITMDDIKVGEKLPSEANKTSVVITNTYDINTVISWSKLNTDTVTYSNSSELNWTEITDPEYTAEYDTVYRATIKPMLAGSGFSGNYTIDSNVDIEVNDSKLTFEDMSISTTGAVLYYMVQTEANVVSNDKALASVIQPKTIIINQGETPIPPSTVKIKLVDGTIIDSDVEWDTVSGVSPSSGTDTIITKTGNVKYANNLNNVSTAVTQTFIVKGLDKTESAKANRESGSYNGDMRVTLSSKTPDAKIIYTLDESDPLTSATAKEYDGTPITIKASDNAITLLTCAYLEDNSLLPSDYEVYTYRVSALVQYNVEYDLNGGTAPDDADYSLATVNSGTYITAKQAPSRSGYTFKAWKDSEGNEYLPEDEIVINDNVKLTAQWEANKYTVKFDANGGNGDMQNQTFTYDNAEAISANTFTKDGYTFNGWNTNKDGSGTAYTDKQVINNITDVADKEITLYAQWKKIDSDNPGTPENPSNPVTPGNPEAPTKPGISGDSGASIDADNNNGSGNISDGNINDSANEAAENADAANTGDTNNMAVWFIILLVAAAVIIFSITKRKYNKNK